MGKCALSGWVTPTPVLRSAGVHYWPPQPIYSQSPHFGQSSPATGSPSTADDRRNRSFILTHAPISSRQVFSVNFQYKGVIFDLNIFWTVSQEARWHLMFWKGKIFPAVTDPLSSSFILLNNCWHANSSGLLFWKNCQLTKKGYI